MEAQTQQTFAVRPRKLRPNPASFTMTGPLAAGALMEQFGPGALFGMFAVVFGCTALFAFSDWLMPRFRPAISAEYQPAPPMTPPDLPSADEVFTELDIGPDIPPDFAPPEEESEAPPPAEDVGPPAPEAEEEK